MAGHTLAYFGGSRWRRATGHLPRKATQVPGDFLGLCVANAPESACDDYIIARLNELGIRHVRLDFTYADREAFTGRFLDRLLAENFHICLHLVQPREEARKMLNRLETAERWREFVGNMLDHYGSRVDLIEIGSTCNRRKWSGYTPAGFFAAWQIAWEEARGRNLPIAGPNVTDFEPAYNTGWLGELRRAGMAPGVHTDNLFVERATEPEAFDHKIAGRRLANLLRFNLVRKAQLLQDIGAWAGVPALMCTHVTWSLRRIARFLENVEEKQADYLARYVCLAAASGALARVYWGPLIGQREGLIDDGTSEYPEIPRVTYYEQARGIIENYRLRPAFKTLQTVNRLLSGAKFKRRLATGYGLEILEFELHGEFKIAHAELADRKSQTLADASQNTFAAQRSTLNAPEVQQILHAVWTTDGNGASTAACYSPELITRAAIYSRDGQMLADAPRMFSESPVFLVWPESTWNAARQTLSAGKTGKNQPPQRDHSKVETTPHSTLHALRPTILPGFRFAWQSGRDFDIVLAGGNVLGLTGVYLAADDTERVDIQALIDLLRKSNTAGSGQRPESSRADDLNGKTLAKTEALIDRGSQKLKTLRDSRNMVWSVNAPWNPGRTIVIKEFKTRSIFRRALDYGKPNKALRSWNGAQELLRRGLQTPTPLACLAPASASAGNTKAGYYICEAFAPAWSARDVFNAFSKGAQDFQGYSTTDWYVAIAVFLQKLHTRGVYFRDLSAGNLLARRASSGKLEFALIDTARARFYPRSLGLRLRLCDLMRLCHPLIWPSRLIFVEQYLTHNGRRFKWWMRIPFWYYDSKHRLKNTLKKIRL